MLSFFLTIICGIILCIFLYFFLLLFSILNDRVSVKRRSFGNIKRFSKLLLMRSSYELCFSSSSSLVFMLISSFTSIASLFSILCLSLLNVDQVIDVHCCFVFFFELDEALHSVHFDQFISKSFPCRSRSKSVSIKVTFYIRECTGLYRFYYRQVRYFYQYRS